MNDTAKSFGIVTLFSVATRFASFIFKIWSSRVLGAEAVGQYQIALSVLMMLFTVTAGAPVVLSRKVAEASVTGDTKRQNALTCASLILGIVPAIAICAILYALGDKISHIFSNPDCLPVFFIMLPTLLTSTIYASLRSWFWGRKNFLTFSSTELCDELIRIALAVLFASGIISSISGAKAIAVASTISDAVCVIILAILFFAFGGRIVKPRGFKELASRTIPLSATRIISSLGASLTAYVIPQMLIASGLSVAQATAQYGRVSGMAFPLIMAPMTFIGALSVVLTPDIASLRTKGDTSALKCKLASSLSFATVVASFFFALYLPLGKYFGIVLFDDEIAGSFVSQCALIIFPIATAQATTPMVNSLGKERHTLVFTLIGSLSMLPCIFFLPQVIGIYSMAVATALCFTIIAICNLVVLKKEVGAFANHKKTIPLILLSTLLAISAMFLARLLNAYAGQWTAIIVCCVYIVFFYFLIINAFDVIDIIAYVKALKPRAFSLKRHKKRANAPNRTKSRFSRKTSAKLI